MKIIIFLLGSIPFLSHNIYSQNMYRYNNDKVIHFSAGVLISVASSELFYNRTHNRKASLLFGVGMATLAGLMKEIYDSTGKGNRDVKDFLWTATGSTIPSLCFIIHI